MLSSKPPITAPAKPPKIGENGEGKLLARLAPIPAPAIDEKLFALPE